MKHTPTPEKVRNTWYPKNDGSLNVPGPKRFKCVNLLISSFPQRSVSIFFGKNQPFQMMLTCTGCWKKKPDNEAGTVNGIKNMGYAAHRYDSMFRATVQVLRGIWCNVGNGVRLSICFGFRLAKAWWLLFCCVFFPCIFRCRKENNRARRSGVWKLWSFFCGLGLKTATVTALCPNRKQLVIPRYIWEKQKNSREQPSLKLTVRPLKRVFCSKRKQEHETRSQKNTRMTWWVFWFGDLKFRE